MHGTSTHYVDRRPLIPADLKSRGPNAPRSPHCDVRAFGRFQVKEEIARGGMGVVLRVGHPDLGRDVAVKVLTQRSEIAVRRFEREARVVAQLRHPNIVSVLETGIHEGARFLVMDLIEGETLQQRLARSGWLDLREAAEMIRKLALAVEHAHTRGVLHRDVKPANIIVDPDGEPHLTDFGLARDVHEGRSSLTKTGMFMGTPSYWPPEQARGQHEALGPASDVYSLGATLYAAITGRPPFDGDTLVELLERACTEPPARPSRHRPEVDPALEAICLTCLAKSPGDRYRSAELLAETLADYLASEPTKRARFPLAPVAGVVVLGLGVGALVWPRAAPSPATPPPAETIEPPAPRPTAPPQPERPAARELLDPRELLDESRRRLKAADVPGSLAAIESALLLAPGDTILIAQRGRVRGAAGDTEGALADFDRAIAADPGSSTLHSGRALVRVYAGRLGEAGADLERALELDPENAKAYLIRALIRSTSGDLEGALPDVDAALSRDPSLVQGYVIRGRALLARGTAEAAILQLDRGFALDPDDAQILHTRGSALIGLERFEEGLADFDRILSRNSASMPAHFSRGMALYGLTRYTEALAALARAERLIPPGNAALRKQLENLRGLIHRDMRKER